MTVSMHMHALVYLQITPACPEEGVSSNCTASGQGQEM